MRKVLWGLAAAIPLTIVAVVAVAYLAISWSRSAETVCREQAPGPATGWSQAWSWREFAYECTYEAPGRPKRRVGFRDAF
jgi:hypothetical protein